MQYNDLLTYESEYCLWGALHPLRARVSTLAVYKDLLRRYSRKFSRWQGPSFKVKFAGCPDSSLMLLEVIGNESLLIDSMRLAPNYETIKFSIFEILQIS